MDTWIDCQYLLISGCISLLQNGNKELLEQSNIYLFRVQINPLFYSVVCDFLAMEQSGSQLVDIGIISYSATDYNVR
ncbi:hypothetical protein [Anaerorudis cellulosivorans]|uniref:hypothetical protein n=1 Tax=Anaerorudis cellulosivorans TaxID=3397862 RepID=UPI002220B3C8|nr:hypothetical protein [Seramator thermalis]MCW1734593.1 hypothetical protein [Seramator thermalis]